MPHATCHMPPPIDLFLRTTMSFRSGSIHRKQSRSEPQFKVEGLCSFCHQLPAVLRVQSGTNTNEPVALCARHYFSTRAVRSESSQVFVLDPAEFEQQLPQVQSLFADVFVELQQELSQEAARAFRTHGNDPLAILHQIHKAPARKKNAKPSKAAPQNVDRSAGGFLRHVELPQRLIQTQQEQLRKQQQLTARMQQAAKQTDISQRRKPSRKSIWNVVMEETSSSSSNGATKGGPTIHNESYHRDPCSCGSSNVEELSSNASRNHDMTKGETWGNKDRGDEIVTRYRCIDCGRVWNED